MKELPKINKSDLPQEMQDKIDGDEVVIEPLVESVEEYDPTEMEQKHASLDRRLQKRADQLQALHKIYDQSRPRKENWKKIKKASRYFKSNLYEIKTLGQNQDRPT